MITRNAKETIRYAQKFAQKLKGGEVIGLIGDLGSGKTTFIKGLARGLGIRDEITSPTFVLMKIYEISRNPNHPIIRLSDHPVLLVHVDAYRIGNPPAGGEDIKSVGIADYLGRQDAVVVIEWADKIQKILPKKTIYIKFKHIDENKREII